MSQQTSVQQTAREIPTPKTTAPAVTVIVSNYTGTMGFADLELARQCGSDANSWK